MSTFASIEEAIDRIRAGEMVLVADDEDRENEGDLTMAAEFVTPEAINFMLRFARGLVCMPSAPEHLERLAIGPMIPAGEEGCDTPFTVSIDHRDSGSGIGAADRARTVTSCSNRNVIVLPQSLRRDEFSGLTPRRGPLFDVTSRRQSGRPRVKLCLGAFE